MQFLSLNCYKKEFFKKIFLTVRNHKKFQCVCKDCGEKLFTMINFKFNAYAFNFISKFDQLFINKIRFF